MAIETFTRGKAASRAPSYCIAGSEPSAIEPRDRLLTLTGCSTETPPIEQPLNTAANAGP